MDSNRNLQVIETSYNLFYNLFSHQFREVKQTKEGVEDALLLDLLQPHPEEEELLLGVMVKI